MLLSLFPHLCFKVAPCSSCSESHILCFKVAPRSSCSESHILFFKVAPCFSYSESHKLSFSYQWESFIIELGLYLPMMGFLKMPQVFVSKRVGYTHTQFLLLSFHIPIALVSPLHGNPYSLTLISIDGHLHSPLISLVNVRLSPSFLSSPQPPYSIPPIVLYPWLTLMYRVKVEKV